MIYNKDEILIPELCPIFFGEHMDVDLYPYQEDYIPKLHSDTKIIAFFSPERYNVDVVADVYTPNDLKFKVFTTEGILLYEETIAIKIMNEQYYYAIIDVSVEIIEGIEQDVFGYFTIESIELESALARSCYYLFNPSYKGDLKKISFSHKTNDYNVIFVEEDNTKHEYSFDIECAFNPQNSRIEQQVEDFLSQDMVNKTVYGDEYVVKSLLIGDSNGVPLWVRNLFSRASLCSTFKINEQLHVKIQGAKVEQVAECTEGLNVYKLDLQEAENYKQQLDEFYGIFDETYNEVFI